MKGKLKHSNFNSKILSKLKENLLKEDSTNPKLFSKEQEKKLLEIFI
jgi:hypothetical protein